jgi:hypothetical protein
MQTNQDPARAGAWLLVAATVLLLAVTMGSRTVFGLFISPLNSASVTAADSGAGGCACRLTPRRLPYFFVFDLRAGRPEPQPTVSSPLP